MGETPGSDQISEFLQEARRSVSAVQASDRNQKASPLDLRQSRQVSESHMRGISSLQESFARRINESLSAYLRAAIDMKFASMEQKSFSEFLKALAEPAYVASMRIPTLSACALMHIDLPLVFQMLDLLLGGDGKEQASARDLTEIEEEIFESVTRIFCDELRSAWQPVLETDIRFDRRIQLTRLLSPMSASEKLLLANFDVTLAENQGKLILAFPAAVTTALIRDIAVEPAYAEPTNSQKNRARLQELVANCRFDAELMLPPSSISVRELFALQPGSIVVLNVRASEPIHLNVAGKHIFLAVPVGCGSQRGAQIEKLLSIAPDKESE